MSTKQFCSRSANLLMEDRKILWKSDNFVLFVMALGNDFMRKMLEARTECGAEVCTWIEFLHSPQFTHVVETQGAVSKLLLQIRDPAPKARKVGHGSHLPWWLFMYCLLLYLSHLGWLLTGDSDGNSQRLTSSLMSGLPQSTGKRSQKSKPCGVTSKSLDLPPSPFHHPLMALVFCKADTSQQGCSEEKCIGSTSSLSHLLHLDTVSGGESRLVSFHCWSQAVHA